MTTRAIHDELIVVDHPILNQRVAFVLPAIPDDPPYRIREGIARRRISVLTGSCPCGATVDVANGLEPGQVTGIEIEHENRCPAITKTLLNAISRWAR
jgi:hypothetical protein